DEAEAAAGVLDALVDARLLTTYEEAETEDRPASRRLEVVHESLLAKWPRLVRWRTQDAEGAQLRDDLRQTAQRWRERDKPDDLLWTGTSFKEYELWRERYPGGLTAEEEEFARAMKARAERRKRQRRLAVGVAFVVLLAVLAVVGGFWRQAVAEAKRAEAQKLLALGQLQLEEYSTATLAYATRSIAVSDSREARQLALEALWQGPPAWQVVPEGALGTLFSPDDRWLGQGRLVRSPDAAEQPKVRLISNDGASRLLERIYDQGGAGLLAWLSADLFLTRSFRQGAGPAGYVFDYGVWSAEAGHAVARAFDIPMWPSQADHFGWDAGRSELVVLLPDGEVRSYGLGGAGTRSAGVIEAIGRQETERVAVSGSGRWVATTRGGEIVLHPLVDGRLQSARALGRHDGLSSLQPGPPGTDLLVTRSESGEVRVWDPSSGQSPQTVQGPPGSGEASLGGDGSTLVVGVEDPEAPGAVRLWVGSAGSETRRLRELGSHRLSDWGLAVDPGRRHVALSGTGVRWARLDAPADAQPVDLETRTSAAVRGIGFDSKGRWLVGANVGTFLWSLERPYPFVVERSAGSPVFDPSGRWLLTTRVGEEGARTIEMWDFEESGVRTEVWRRRTRGTFTGLAVAPDGRRALVGHRFFSPGPLLLSLEDGSAEPLPDGFEDQSFVSSSSDGRWGAASGGQFLENENRVKVWDLDRRELVATLAPEEAIAHCCTAFTPENDVLWASTASGLWRWSFESDERERVYEGAVGEFWPDAEGRRVLMRLHDDEANTRKLVWLDLESGETVALASHGDQVAAAALGPEGRIVASAGDDRIVRVGRADGGEPHLLFRQADRVRGIAVDPLGRWVVTSGGGELRFWPLPDVDRTPTHALLKEELVDLLEAQTNLRLVESPEDPTGWTLEWGPFPGWSESPPSW
ncbi:MAG: WD40 repeat domain-containing protein, partial [Thermoanaerobaculia bacterium]|nr:WD40 repeat domain-containing protein [Thermoanaerobaculia bacterium]